MKRKISARDNSKSVRLPTSVLKALQLSVGDVVASSTMGSKIIIEEDNGYIYLKEILNDFDSSGFTDEEWNTATLEKIEDYIDIEIFKKTLAEHKANPRTYTHEEVKKKLGLL